jgi:small ligand-binding sensory domain FIST
MSQTLPVREWYVRLEHVRDSEAAFEGWRQLVIAQGWSPVGDPWIVRDGADPAVVGRLVQHPGLTVNPDARHVVFP